MNSLLSGKRFNELYKEIMIKSTNYCENHNGFQFETGLNIDHLPFYAIEECKAGGIYFLQSMT